MNKLAEMRLKSRKWFYIATLFSVFLVFFGFTLSKVVDNLKLDLGDFEVFFRDFIGIVSISTPFILSAWLILLGLLFVKKDWKVLLTISFLAIPHIILIGVMVGYSHSPLYILRYYIFLLSFGLLRL